MTSSSGPHITILGLMGVGKSTTGTAVARTLGRSYVDSDRDIERLVGITGGEYAESAGIPALHTLESAVLLGALSRSEPLVISAAASVVEQAQVRAILPMRSFVVRLSIPHTEAIRRQDQGEHRRSMNLEELTELAQRREPLFGAVEHLHLDATAPTERLVEQIIAATS